MISAPTVNLRAPAATTLSLPSERLAQLRALSNVRRTTLIGLLESVINQAIASGEIPDAIEGFQAIHDDNVVFLKIRDVDLPPITCGRVMLLVSLLEIAAGKSDHIRLDAGGAPFEIEDGDAKTTLLVGRHGRGVVLSIHNSRTGETVKSATTPSIIGDFAAMIRREIGVEPYYKD